MRIVYAIIFSSVTLFQIALAWGETPDQVAQRARSLLTDPSTFGVGVLSSKYPDDYNDKELRGFVSSGSEYFAPCYSNGDLLFLALPVSQNWRNALYSPGKNATFEIISNPDPKIPDPRHQTSKGDWDPKRPKWRRGMYSKQRLTLFGHLKTIQKDDEMSKNILQKCYLSYHPDAKHFIPGSPDSPHLAIWTTFIIDRVYRVGGYGDESQIGWLDIDRWHRGDRRNNDQKWKTIDQQDSLFQFSANETIEDAVLSQEDIASLFADQRSAFAASNRFVIQRQHSVVA